MHPAYKVLDLLIFHFFLQTSMGSLPDRPASLLKESSTNDSITVTWIPPKSTKYDGYRIAISPPNQKTEVLARSVISHTFRDLMSSQRYTITLTTVLNDVESKQLSSDFYTNPDAPTNVRILSRTDTRITFIWSPPANPGEIDDYQCYLQDSKGHEITSFDNYGSDIREHSFDIYAGRTYIISVYAYAYYKLKGMPASLRFSIIPAVPHNVRVTARGQSYLECEFFGQSNSYYDGFEITWLEKASSAKPSNAFLQREDVSYVITDLKSSTTYDIMVYATSGEQKSRGVALETSTKASSEAELFVKSYDQQSITVAWKKPSGKTVDGLKLNIDPVPNAQMGSEEVATDIQEHTWEGLEAGHEYTLEIEVIYADATSEKVNRKQTTQPMPVLSLSTNFTSSSEITLSWNVDRSSSQDNFAISYGGTGRGNINRRHVRFTQGQLQYVYSITSFFYAGLTYSFSVFAVKNYVQSSPYRALHTLKPKLVRNLKAEVSPGGLMLSWDSGIKSFENSYRYQYVGRIAKLNSVPWEITTSKRVKLEHLFPGEIYEFYVEAIANGKHSLYNRSVIATIPPLPPLGLTIDIAETTESSVLMFWEDDETRSYITSWDVEIADIGTYRPKAVGSTSDRTVLDYEITNLISGKNYTAYVFGKSGDQRSYQAATVDLTLKPVINSVLSEDTDQTKENVIVLTYNRSNVGEFDHYLFSLNGSSDTVTVAKQHRHLYPRITFTNLVSGENYVVTARTISGIEESTPIQKSIVTKPFAPNWACDQGADRLTIILSKPLGFVDEYILECQEGCSQRNTTLRPTESTKQEIRNLTPFKEYRFKVWSVRLGKYSEAASFSCTTEMKAPGPVRDFRYTDLRPRELRLNWNDPLSKNGEINAYHIAYTGSKVDQPMDTQKIDGVGPNERSYLIKNLGPGFNYTFSIRAETIFVGERQSLTVTMPILAPAVDATLRKSTWIPSEISPHEFQVELINPFLNTNGDVVEFSLLVTTDRDDSRNRAANQPSWKDSKDKLPMPPYFAVNRCSDLFDGDNMCWSTSRKKRNVVEPGTSVHFTVGGTLNCDIRDDSFCNGPLQADSTYHVAIVGYTENGLHTVGPISGPIRTGSAGTTAEDPNQPKSVNIVTIAVGVGLGILLLISVLTSLAIFHCRKRVARPDTRPQEDMAVGSDPTYTSADQVVLPVESGPLNADDLPRQPTSVASPDTGYEALDVENSNNQRDDYEVLEGIYHEIPDATD